MSSELRINNQSPNSLFKTIQKRSLQLFIAQILIGLAVFSLVACFRRPLPMATLRSYLFIPLIVTLIFTTICFGNATYLLYERNHLRPKKHENSADDGGN